MDRLVPVHGRPAPPYRRLVRAALPPRRSYLHHVDSSTTTDSSFPDPFRPDAEAFLNTDARRFLPLTHLAFHVLLSLAAGDGHGYGIIRDIEERSDGLVSPGTGSFYEIVRRMCDDGLIDEVEAPEESRDARRRYYGITPLGREVLRLETVRLTGLVREIRRLGVLGGPAA